MTIWRFVYPYRSLIEIKLFMYTFRHSALMYGNFKTKPNAIDEKAAKMARLSKMKKIYLPPRLSPSK